MVEAVTSAIGDVFYFAQRTIYWLFLSSSSSVAYIRDHLRVVFFIGLGIAVLYLGFRIIKSVIWGK